MAPLTLLKTLTLLTLASSSVVANHQNYPRYASGSPSPYFPTGPTGSVSGSGSGSGTGYPHSTGSGLGSGTGYPHPTATGVGIFPRVAPSGTASAPSVLPTGTRQLKRFEMRGLKMETKEKKRGY